MHLADMIECVSTVEKHRRSMDENAVRYLLFFRQHVIRRSQALVNRAGITYREIVWAYHSGSQEILVDLVSRQFQGRMLWGHAKECGMFMWMTDLTALVRAWRQYSPLPYVANVSPESAIRGNSAQRVHQD